MNDIIKNIHYTLRKAEAECYVANYFKFVYLGIYEYEELKSYARQNMEFFVARNVDEWGKEMIFGLEVVPVDKYTWLKVGA